MSTPPKSIRTDYATDAASLRAFYQYSPVNPDFSQIIKDKASNPVDRVLLAKVIEEQYEGLDMSPKMKENLQKLRQPNSFTITTGHQLVFLGGPLFTTYKVLHVIKLAEQLSALYPDTPVIPIFWIHTEDHDFEEINHYYKDFDTKITYQGKFNGNVGSHQIEEGIENLFPTHFPQNLTQAFSKGSSWAQAYRAYMHKLFGDYGILMLDPDDARLKAQFGKVISEELLHQHSFHLINQHSDHLVKEGYKAQILPREINLFYLNDTVRNRIIRENGSFKVIDTEISFQEEEMMRMVDEHPEYFSPNVSLRPLYQEIILPNLAYVGGWGELSYWLQLKGVFDHYRINFPLLLPRFSATLLEKDLYDQWKAFGFSEGELHKDAFSLFNQILPRFWSDDELSKHEKAIEHSFDQLKAYIESFSPSMPRSVEGQKVKTQRFFRNQRKKLKRLVREQHPEFKQLAALKHAIQADGKVQERVLSLASFPLIPPDELIEQIWQCVEPLSMAHTYIHLNG